MESGHFAEIRVSKYRYSEDGENWDDYKYELALFRDREKLIPGDLLFLSSLQTIQEGIGRLRERGCCGIGISIIHSDRNYNSGKILGFHRIYNGNLLHVIKADEDELKEIFEGIKYE